jgi:hypothetical protein
LTVLRKDSNALDFTLTNLKLSHDDEVISSTTYYTKGNPKPEKHFSIVWDQKASVHLASVGNRLLK